MQGSVLNEIYQVRSQLSKRGGRETLLAKNLETDELVVVKLLKFGLDAVWQDFKLFEREAQTLKNIDHPAIPNYLDYFDLDLTNCKGFALVQEYIEAPSLEASVKAGRNFSTEEIKEIATELLKILQYLHQRQPSIIHRDIKPSNILLTDRSGNSVGQVYLIDFGAVNNVAAAEGGTITIVGTYGYMPPEQFGGQTRPASDLYSLGATLIYLATGRNPTELPSKDGKIIFAEAVNLSPAFSRWLDRMIEPSGDRRFQSATEALNALTDPPNLAKISLDKDDQQITSQDAAIVRQPVYSKVKLSKTPTEFEILIPPQGFVPSLIFLIIFSLFWNAFLLFWTGGALSIVPNPINIFFGLFSIPFWLVGFSLVGTIIFTIFGSTRLRISPKQISLTYECLKLKLQRPKPTARRHIEELNLSKINSQVSSQKGNSTLTIWANKKAYRIRGISESKHSTDISRHNISADELSWLANELSEWLDMPIKVN